MDWSLATWWWIVTGVLVAAELATGTFYLLMLALGAAAAALAAHAGLAGSLQIVTAAVVGGTAVAAWHLKRQREPVSPPVSEDRNVNLDIGERLEVNDWHADGTGFAMYRGARWAVRHEGPGAPAPGWHVIRRVEGNRLHVQPVS